MSSGAGRGSGFVSSRLFRLVVERSSCSSNVQGLFFALDSLGPML